MNMFFAISRIIRAVHKTLRAVIGIGAIAVAAVRWATGNKKRAEARYQSFTPVAARHA